jgi:hypothetical protein
MRLDAAQDRRSKLLIDPAAKATDPDPTSTAADVWKEQILGTPSRRRA